jgi:hypothetical protein
LALRFTVEYDEFKFRFQALDEPLGVDDQRLRFEPRLLYKPSVLRLPDIKIAAEE